MIKQTLTTEREMYVYAGQYIERILRTHLHTPITLGLVGDLGAGKTTFVRGVARHMGIEEPITSPTFLIKKEYVIHPAQSGKERLVHVDAYRVDAASELDAVGVTGDIANPVTVTIIEWAGRVAGALPAHTQWLSFSVGGATTRHVYEHNHAPVTYA